jgi:hypothetical protein
MHATGEGVAADTATHGGRVSRPTSQIVASLQQARRQLAIVEERMPELLRRDALAGGSDGYPSGGGGGRGSKGGHADPTSSAALGRPERDVVHDWTAGIIRAVEAACDQINLAAALVYQVDRHVEDRASSATEAAVCMACGDPAPGGLRRGLDEKCYKAWSRADRPDIVVWITSRKVAP